MEQQLNKEKEEVPETKGYRGEAREDLETPRIRGQQGEGRQLRI